MGTDARGHTSPIPGETPRRQVFNDLSMTIYDIVPVANATARTTLPSTLQTAGYPVSAAKPLFVRQQDTRQYWEFDGGTWIPFSSANIGASWAADRQSGNSADNLATGSYYSVCAVSLDTFAQPGRYLINANACLTLAAAGASIIYVRVMLGATNISGDFRADWNQANGISNVPFNKVVNYSGGTGLLDLQIETANVTATIFTAGTRISATYLGT